MILKNNEYDIQLDITDIKNIIVNVKYLHKTFKTILPKNLEKHGFKKYNLATTLYNLIIFNSYKIQYDKITGLMILIFLNVIFDPDGKVYNGEITVNLEEYIDYEDLDLKSIIENLDNIDLVTLKKIIILNYNHNEILQRKIKLLEEKIDELNNQIDFDHY
jgi:hypothetical protein